MVRATVIRLLPLFTVASPITIFKTQLCIHIPKYGLISTDPEDSLQACRIGLCIV